MPIYDYKCEECGHEFDVMQKFDDPAPPCPAPAGLPGGEAWADIWADAQKNFAAGKKTPYPAAPRFTDVGPEFEHTVIRVAGTKPTESCTKTMAEWLETSSGPCGGATKRQISKSSFHLKGTGWYKTDYRD